MAKSAEQDKGKKDEGAEGEVEETAAAKDADEAKAAPADASEPAGDKPSATEAEAHEDDEEEKPAAKPVAKPAAKTGSAAKRPGVRPGAKRTPPPQRGGSLGKSVILFVIIVGGLAAGFAILGREEGGGGIAKPKWKLGDTVDVEITLVKTDIKDLACSSPDEVGGKHCAFESQTKAWSKDPGTDDKKLLKPYTTVDRIQFVGAGLWADPGMQQDKLPSTRFSVKCKYKVESTLKKLDIKWEQTGQWFPNTDWYAGALSDCKVVQ